jgi:membrane protein DedA with SNARE-associated domain
MKLSLRTYTAYNIGCALVWAVIWVVLAADACRHTKHTLLLVFGGWWIWMALSQVG